MVWLPARDDAMATGKLESRGGVIYTYGTGGGQRRGLAGPEAANMATELSAPARDRVGSWGGSEIAMRVGRSPSLAAGPCGCPALPCCG
jgi:hypothetical protein